MILGYVDTDDPIIQKSMVKEYGETVAHLAQKICALDVSEK
jgi:hypothetical protein